MTIELLTLAPEVPRDGYERPLIMPADGGKPAPYTRASTFANALDDAQGLTIWKLRNLALGMGRHEDLAAMAAGLTYENDKKTLDEIVKTAIDRAGGTVKANWGTAVHSLTEPDSPPYVPARMQTDVAAYNAALAKYGITVVDTERFVVNDAIGVAGTFDHIYAVPGLGNVPGDKKTGSFHPDACAVQLATYARGVYYRLDDTGAPVREPLPDVRTDIGIVAHIPAGQGRCDLYVVNLDAGWEAAQLAVQVREWRVRKDLATPLAEYATPVAPAPPAPAAVTAEELADLIATAPDEAALHQLKAAHAAAWTAEHSELANARWALLTGGLLAAS